MAAILLNIQPGDEVIVPSITFVASAAAILYLGAKPIFVDVDEKDWLLDISKIKKNITKKTKAIMAVHLHGLMCDMKAIKKLANKIDKNYNIVSTKNRGDCLFLLFLQQNIVHTCIYVCKWERGLQQMTMMIEI